MKKKMYWPPYWKKALIRFYKNSKCWAGFLLLCFSGVLLTYGFTEQLPNHHQIAISKWSPLKMKPGETLCLKLLPGIYSSDIPNETLDPNSQFYKLTYKDTYGKPTFCEPDRDTFYINYTKNLPTWEKFFPNLVTSLKKYAELNPVKNVSKFTSPKSYINLNQVKKEYKVGETFEVSIQAIDFEGEKKRFGGDFFRARLLEVSTEKNSFPNGIPCNILDQMNGTYTVTAPLLVPGKFKLEVVLSTSVEAIAAYIDWTAGRVHQGWVFEATLETNELVECNLDLLLYDTYKDKEICDYSNPRNGEPFFCGKPASGKCTSIKFMKVKSGFLNNPFNLNHQLMHRFQVYQAINGFSSYLKVTSNKNGTTQDTLSRIRQVAANTDIFGNSSEPHITGMGYSGHWVSFVRNYERPQAKDFAKCFSNKVVFMIGDSTMRQFFLFAAAEFKLQIYQIHEKNFYHVPRLGRSETQNITIYYRAHGIPMRLPGPLSLSTYMTDTINEVTGGKNVVIIITIGLHYLEYDPVFYIHRLVGIRKALEHHLKKYPDTKIIIKGINRSIFKQTYINEWLQVRFDTILKEMLKNLKNFIHIDLLDMTALWPVYENYHPEEHVIREQAYLMFSYICDMQ